MRKFRNHLGALATLTVASAGLTVNLKEAYGPTSPDAVSDRTFPGENGGMRLCDTWLGMNSSVYRDCLKQTAAGRNYAPNPSWVSDQAAKARVLDVQQRQAEGRFYNRPAGTAGGTEWNGPITHESASKAAAIAASELFVCLDRTVSRAKKKSIRPDTLKLVLDGSCKKEESKAGSALIISLRAYTSSSNIEHALTISMKKFERDLESRKAEIIAAYVLAD